MSDTDLCARCGGDCGMSSCPECAGGTFRECPACLPDPAGSDEDWESGCDHEHDEDCEDHCYHEHCFACGECGCPGYCDDYQTYNLRPAETGGSEPGGMASA